MAQLPYAASHHKGWQIDQTFHPKPSYLAQWSKRRKIESLNFAKKHIKCMILQYTTYAHCSTEYLYGGHAIALPIKNNYLKILMLMQMEVTMKTIACYWHVHITDYVDID